MLCHQRPAVFQVPFDGTKLTGRHILLTIQNKISENARKQQELFDQNELILLGTNKLPSQNDRMKNELQIYPFLKKKNSKTLIVPILQRRLSEQHEQNRLKME